jgi:hypothetical protein
MVQQNSREFLVHRKFINFPVLKIMADFYVQEIPLNFFVLHPPKISVEIFNNYLVDNTYKEATRI